MKGHTHDKRAEDREGEWTELFNLCCDWDEYM